MSYGLGVDLGTSFTAAAVFRDGRSEIVELGERRAQIPTVVHISASGAVTVGDPAERRAVSDPDGIVRDFKRRLGDHVGSLVRTELWSAEALMGAVLAHVIEVVTARQGEAPAALALSHPASWGQYKLDLLREAARLAGVDEVSFVAEPVAAALHHTASRNAAPGGCYLVYDLGGGTFDVAVVRTGGGPGPDAPRGGEIVGRPDGLERMGGIDIDEALRGVIERLCDAPLSSVDVSDPSALHGIARFRADVVAAKEALSIETSVEVPLFVPSLPSVVRVTRAELEEAIHRRVADTIAITERVVAGADLTDDESATLTVLLVGGSSRIPLVGRMVAERLHLPTSLDEHPKHPVALGAAWLAASSRPDVVSGIAADSDSPGDVDAAVPLSATSGFDVRTADPRIGPWYRRSSRALAAALCTVLLLVTGVALTLRGDGGGEGAAGAEPKTIQPISTLPDAPATHSSPIAQLASGLVVSRTWTLRGRELTATVVALNASPAPLTTDLEEVFPRSLVRSLDAIAFTPEPDQRIEADLVAVYRITALAAGASQQFRYVVAVSASEDPPDERLEAWERDRAADAERRAGATRVILTELALDHTNLDLEAGTRAEVTLFGTMSDGQAAAPAVLAAVAVTSSDATVATAATKAGGLTIEAKAPGGAVLSVRSGETTASLTVTVRAAPDASVTTTRPDVRVGADTPTTTRPSDRPITTTTPPATQPPTGVATLPPTSAATTVPPPPPSGLAPGGYEEGSVTATSGAWFTCTAPLGQSGGCDIWTSTAGHSYEIRFHGTGIAIYGAKAFNGGQMSFTVDGGHHGTVDSYFDGNPQRRIDTAEYYRVVGLANTDHTLVATMLPSRHPSNTQHTAYVTLDRFDVLG